jgi:uncharacterized damage-inducible protein DinB
MENIPHMRLFRTVKFRNFKTREYPMDMLQHFSQLFAYDEWANRKVLASLAAALNLSARSLKLFAHIVSAERLWLERLQRQKQSYPVWPDFSLVQCKTEITELPQLWRNYFKHLEPEDLSDEVAYVNSKGECWNNSVQDILTHTVMHSAYHRGQIAADMRATGNVPAYTDFIHGVRQRLVE